MTTATQADFARQIGVARSYVTALKKAGRLVMDDSGRVLVEESKASIARSNGAPERSSVVEPAFADSRERKEHYSAELSRLDFEERCGKLMESSVVLGVVAGAAVTLRSRLETFPDLLAPQLAAIGDEQQIRAMLADQVEILLGELAEKFAEIGKAA